MRVLILAPHTDDGELGCGGTIAYLTRKKHIVYYLAFSAAEKSVPPLFPRNILRTEVKEATKILGILNSNLEVLDFEVRCFPKYRQAILEKMVNIKEDFQPNLVFIPCQGDTHQDHKVISEEGFRAFKKSTILGYELPWNNRFSVLTAFCPLEQIEINSKIQAAKIYESQKYRMPDPSTILISLAKVRGYQIGSDYAEAFEVFRWILPTF